MQFAVDFFRGNRQCMNTHADGVGNGVGNRCRNRIEADLAEDPEDKKRMLYVLAQVYDRELKDVGKAIEAIVGKRDVAPAEMEKVAGLLFGSNEGAGQVPARQVPRGQPILQTRQRADSATPRVGSVHPGW